MKSVVHIGGWRSHQTGVPFLRCVKSVVHQWLETATKQEKHLSHLWKVLCTPVTGARHQAGVAFSSILKSVVHTGSQQPLFRTYQKLCH